MIPTTVGQVHPHVGSFSWIIIPAIRCMNDESDHYLSGQNGIWVKIWHFWPKNDGEKWSRKNLFKKSFLLHRRVDLC